MYARRIGVTGTARVIPRVFEGGTADSELRLRAGARFRIHSNTPAGCIVIDHAIVVVPEYVLRWSWTLEGRNIIVFIILDRYFNSIYILTARLEV